jgi:parallel beta-helix repeat protein
LWKIALTAIVTILFLAAFTAIGSAATIYVPDDYGTIQAAVEAVNEGDTIIVRDGIYTENVDVRYLKNNHLTIRSENGPDSTIVLAEDPDDDVFFVGQDYVNISGFTVTGAGAHYSGIYLRGDYCTISNNNASNNGFAGIYVSYSTNNTISGNTANSNSHDGIILQNSSNSTITNNIANLNTNFGIRLLYSINSTVANNTLNLNTDDGVCIAHSSNNIVTSNTASNSRFGIYLSRSNNNTLTSNTATNNGEGIYLVESTNNLIYNNYFDNTNNAQDYGNNIWNITKTEGTNIIGGIYIGGNYWSDYRGVDLDGDGLGDTDLPYNSYGDIQQGGDWRPLVERAPDLVISDTWVYSNNCTICYNVTNIGTGTAPACHNTTLYVDGVEVAYDHVPVDLAPNASYIGCFDDYTWTYTPPSDNITVCADNNETIVELNETNNCVTNIWMCGDVNCDGKVTMSDVRKVFNRYLDPNYPLDLPWAADVNCNGKVTMSDVRKVFNRYLDPGYELNCCCEGNG